MKYILVITTWFLLTGASCKKSTTQEDQLPPITQTGANTFGCIVNGKVWIPKGYSGTGTPNPKISFDIYNGKNIFSINTYQFENNNPAGFLSISLFDSIISPGIFDHAEKMNFSVGWTKVLNNCFTPAFDTTVKKVGNVTITRFDETNKIISGTFNCKFKMQMCDTIYITQGRFDFKF